MKRVGFLLKVKEGRLEEYKEHHRAVWPDMLEALSRNGWHNYSLFMREDGLLFGYFEADESLAASVGGDGRRGRKPPMAGDDGALLRDSARRPPRPDAGRARRGLPYRLRQCSPLSPAREKVSACPELAEGMRGNQAASP